MSDLLGISGNAVNAYQLALGTVSNNIANVATEGYTRQSIDLQASKPRLVGTAYIGSGVTFEQVKRQFDAFAEANVRHSNSDLQSQSQVVSYTNRVIDIMGGEATGLVSAMDRFFASARTLATDPASGVLRTAFLRDAQGLVARFGQIDSQLEMVDVETREAVQAGVATINTLTTRLAAVNSQLGKTRELSRQPPELLDQRDRLLSELSQFARINTSFAENGMVNVSLGPTITKDVIVQGQRAILVGANFDAASPEKIGLVLDPYGSQPAPINGITSGQIAGLLSVREQVLNSSRSAIDYLASQLVREVNTIHHEGVDAYGELGGDLFTIEAGSGSLASRLAVAITDPGRIAAAARFRVSEQASNTGTADALVSYEAPPSVVPAPLPQVLLNNPHPSSGKSFALTGAAPMAPVASIQAGMKDVVIYLDRPQGDQQLQLITRDGRHLVGSPLDLDHQAALVTQPGTETAATYSAEYLNMSGSDGYRGMTVFYGARAEPRLLQGIDNRGNTVKAQLAPAVLSGGRMSASLTSIAAGTFTLNGKALPALDAGGRPLTAGDVASWLSAAGQAQGISARAYNEVKALRRALDLDQSLTLNGVTVSKPYGSPSSVQGLADAINAVSAQSGVTASVNLEGDLVLGNVAGREGQSITVGALVNGTANALGLEAGVYGGQVEITRSLDNALGGTSIELGFGAGGKPSDLAALGFRTAAYLSGAVPEDVLVSVTDSASGSARVSASYGGAPADPANTLRAAPLQLEFTSLNAATQAMRYRITDVATGSVLAEREILLSDLNGGIGFRGLSITFDGKPAVGDRFTLDGNRDGRGNNDNVRRLAAVETAALVGGRPLNSAYMDHVNDMGNVADQASIAEEALSVVHEQAVEARDRVSGVNLDQEAADLIRFQQAYQASAKVMQIATQLFESVLQVR